jgi:hypothetical protein
MRIYGGVRMEIDSLRASARNPFDPWEDMVLAPLTLADVPLCLIADTVTLPVTVHAEIERGVDAYYGPRLRILNEGRAAAQKETPPTALEGI